MSSAPTLLHLDPREILPDPENVRQGEPDQLDGLAASIRAYGVLQPLGIRRENGHYRLVFGSRRRAAAIAAGLAAVPCLLLPSDGPERALVRQLAENLQRRELNPIEQAEGLARLRRLIARERPGASDRELDQALADEVGLSAATVRRYLGLRELAPAVRDLLASGQLNATQAQHLRAIADPARQEALARLAAERDLSAAQVARAVKAAVNRANLAVEEAVALAERGDPLPDRAAPAERTPVHLPPAPRPEAEDAEEERAADEAAASDEPDLREPTTRDGSRIFRIRSVGSFCDEVDRIARALQEGDLLKALADDPAAPIKLRLALRQAEFVRRALHDLLAARGWL